MTNPALTSVEQITETWARYAELLIGTAVAAHVSPSQASELAALAEQLVCLHEQEADYFRDRAEFWREYRTAKHV